MWDQDWLANASLKLRAFQAVPAVEVCRRDLIRDDTSERHLAWLSGRDDRLRLVKVMNRCLRVRSLRVSFSNALIDSITLIVTGVTGLCRARYGLGQQRLRIVSHLNWRLM